MPYRSTPLSAPGATPKLQMAHVQPSSALAPPYKISLQDALTPPLKKTSAFERRAGAPV